MSQFHLASKVFPGPDTTFHAFPRQVLKGTPQVFIALPTETNNYGLAAPSGDWCCAGSGLHIFPARVAGAIASQFAIEPGSGYLSRRKAGEDIVSWAVLKLLGDVLGKSVNLVQEGAQHWNKTQHYGLVNLFQLLGSP